MTNKLLIVLILAASTSNCALAYNDYGYSYGVSDSYSGGFNSSMHIREMQNDFYRQQAANQPSLSATCNQGSRYFQQPPANTNSFSNSYTQDNSSNMFGR